MIRRPPAWAVVHVPCSIAFGICLPVVLTVLPVHLTEAAESKAGACDEASQGIAQGIAQGVAQGIDNASVESSDTGFGE